MMKQKLKPAPQKALFDSLHIWVQEFRTIFQDKGVMVFFFLVPILYPLLYAYLYNAESVYESKLVVVDMDNTDLSRRYIRMIDGSSGVQVVGTTGSLNEAQRYLWEKKAFAIAQIPQGFRAGLYEGHQKTVTLYSDLSSMLYYKNYMLVLNQAALELGRRYHLEHNTEKSHQSALADIQPIDNEDIAIFNSSAGYASFLLPTILILIIQQTMLMGVSVLSGTAREQKRRHQLMTIALHHRGPMRVVIGKSLAYLTIYTAISIWILQVVPYLFDLPRLAEQRDLVLFLLPFLLSCTFFSLFISSFIRRREDSILLLAFTSVPFVFLSGIVWPESAMPDLWKYFSFVIPSTPGARGFVALNTMGSSLPTVSLYHTILWIQAGGYFILAAITHSFILRHPDKIASSHPFNPENRGAFTYRP